MEQIFKEYGSIFVDIFTAIAVLAILGSITVGTFVGIKSILNASAVPVDAQTSVVENQAGISNGDTAISAYESINPPVVTPLGNMVAGEEILVSDAFQATQDNGEAVVLSVEEIRNIYSGLDAEKEIINNATGQKNAVITKDAAGKCKVLVNRKGIYTFTIVANGTKKITQQFDMVVK